MQRYRIFLFPRKSLFLPTFGPKSSEWVKKLFFFSCLFFFSRVLRLSEWVACKLFQEKKTTSKKKQSKKMIHTPGFYWFYVGKFPKIEWVERKLFLGNKKKHVFFFISRWRKKKQSSQKWVSEWALNFSGEIKKYGTFG